MEPTGQEEERQTENHLEKKKNHRTGDERRKKGCRGDIWSGVPKTGKDGRTSFFVINLLAWPIFLWELKGNTN